MEVKEEDEKKAEVEEFVDKEHESEFCLETNFMKNEEQDAVDKSAQNSKDGKKKIG